MNRPRPVEYADATAEVRAVFDDIKATRNVEDVNNFWKYLASDPALLKRTWETQKQVLAPRALDRLVKERTRSDSGPFDLVSLTRADRAT
jgi:hypothetical protein